LIASLALGEDRVSRATRVASLDDSVIVGYGAGYLLNAGQGLMGGRLRALHQRLELAGRVGKTHYDTVERRCKPTGDVYGNRGSDARAPLCHGVTRHVVGTEPGLSLGPRISEPQVRMRPCVSIGPGVGL